jgi:hypothetical protein
MVLVPVAVQALNPPCQCWDSALNKVMAVTRIVKIKVGPVHHPLKAHGRESYGSIHP